MGTFNYHHIVVTHYDMKKAQALREAVLAVAGALPVSEILLSPQNGVSSFFVATDGSKEGWDTSNRGDICRDAIIGILRGSGAEWAEVSLHEDIFVGCRVTRSYHDYSEEDQS